MTVQLSKKGNTIGWTSEGVQLIGYFRSGAKIWRIAATSAVTELAGHPLNRQFTEKKDAIAYAQSILDVETTRKNAWWSV